MIARSTELERLADLLRQFPVVGLIGARQVGKTTLALALAARFGGEVTHFDLENPRDLSRLDDPLFALEGLKGLVVLDEIQLRPELFPVLRVLADREGVPARFLALGSASPALLRQNSESLAGRIAYHELGGLRLTEVGADQVESLWLRGGFPRSYLAESKPASYRWRRQFVRTYLERDLSELGINLPSTTMRRFWTMLAHYHGELWNGAELARAFGVSHKTVGGYLDTLCSTFMAKRLEPWHENVSKRQVKAPQDLSRGQRNPSHSPRARIATGFAGSPQGRRVVGGFRSLRGHRAPRRPSRGMLLLEASQRRRARPLDPPR
jgi:predicted AAA+ superfamily ATPase